MASFTDFHVLLSLLGILSGLIVLFGLCTSKAMPGWSLLFLVTTMATNLTGFLFPFNGLTPAIGVGFLSTLVLLVTIAARYQHLLVRKWRWIYVIGAVVALYFNVFVLVVQSFLKVPSLHVFAPKGNELPFAITQGVVLLFFIVTGAIAVRKFHPKIV
jgi:hypothetical protein